MNHNFRILVTGVSGFIAPHIANALALLGYKVYGLQRYVTGRTNYKTCSSVNTVFANLCDHMAIRQIIRDIRPDVVIHLAAMSPVSYSYDRYLEVNETNYVATVNLAEACYRYSENLKQFIFAGTSEAYGNQNEFPILESASYYPNSPYACSKVAAIKYLKYMHEAYDFPVTIALPFNTYGRLGTTHFVVERILSQMLSSQKQLLLGDPEPVRDLLFRTDHVKGYLSVLLREESIGEKFNFCTGKGATIEELVDLCAEVTEWKGDIIWHTIPKRPLDIDCLIGDNSKAKQILNWIPEYSLREGLLRTARELQEQCLQSAHGELTAGQKM